MNIFETATKKKYRFGSAKGPLTVEQLWDLPLIDSRAPAETRCDLDTIARAINTELRSISEESFVALKPDPRKGDLETKLEILKHIIAAKQKAIADAEAAANKDSLRRKLVDALASKEDEALASMSRDEILKKLAELDDQSKAA